MRMIGRACLILLLAVPATPALSQVRLPSAPVIVAPPPPPPTMPPLTVPVAPRPPTCHQVCMPDLACPPGQACPQRCQTICN
jgi:hypothetical protein